METKFDYANCDHIRVINATDVDIVAILEWAGSEVSRKGIKAGGEAELPISGLAAWFDIQIRLDNYERTWIAKRNLVPRNMTLKLVKVGDVYTLMEI